MKLWWQSSSVQDKTRTLIFATSKVRPLQMVMTFAYLQSSFKSNGLKGNMSPGTDKSIPAELFIAACSFHFAFGARSFHYFSTQQLINTPTS